MHRVSFLTFECSPGLRGICRVEIHWNLQFIQGQRVKEENTANALIDPTVPIEETLSAISQLYTEGKFKRFGISNFRPADVQKIYDIQTANKSVLPTVFQGNYNPVSRHIEEDLFPLLHKLKISFYAYSPIAGGFLVKDAEQVRNKTAGGRFGENPRVGALYTSMYGKESLFQALGQWGKIAEAAGVSKAALAYRWIAYHSALKKDVSFFFLFLPP